VKDGNNNCYATSSQDTGITHRRRLLQNGYGTC
jgi:hypothetical protein